MLTLTVLLLFSACSDDPDPASFTVTYNSDGGSAVTPQTVVSPATTVGILPAAPTNTGYSFGGWFTATSGGGTEFTADTAVTEDITVYAKWNTIYTVTYNSDGGSAVTPQMVVAPATTVGTLPTAPTMTGYVLGGLCADLFEKAEFEFERFFVGIEGFYFIFFQLFSDVSFSVFNCLFSDVILRGFFSGMAREFDIVSEDPVVSDF